MRRTLPPVKTQKMAANPLKKTDDRGFGRSSSVTVGRCENVDYDWSLSNYVGFYTCPISQGVNSVTVRGDSL